MPEITGMSKEIRVALFGCDESAVRRLGAAMPTGAANLEVASGTGSIDTVAAEIDRARPDLVVIDPGEVGDGALGVLESSLRSSPATAALLLAPQPSAGFLREAMRAGIREVIPTPLVNGELAAAVSRQLERLGLLRAAEPSAKVIAIVPVKGGSGATLVATSLASELAARGRRTLLIDLNAPFGDAALYMTEASPSASLADLTAQVSRLDATLLESSCLSVGEDLSLLAAPDSAERFADITPDALDRVLLTARSRFRFVVLDVGRGVDPVTIRGLDRADEILLIIQLTLPYLNAARRLIDLYQSLGYLPQKLRLVVNRLERGSDISLAEASRTLGLPVAHTLPNSYQSVAWAVNHGQALRESAPRDPVTRALSQLADQIMSSNAGPGPDRGGDDQAGTQGHRRRH